SGSSFVFPTPPKVTFYARNLYLGTPLEIAQRSGEGRRRADMIKTRLWSITTILAGLFCLGALVIIAWLENKLRTKESELLKADRIRAKLVAGASDNAV